MRLRRWTIGHLILLAAALFLAPSLEAARRRSVRQPADVLRFTNNRLATASSVPSLPRPSALTVEARVYQTASLLDTTIVSQDSATSSLFNLHVTRSDQFPGFALGDTCNAYSTQPLQRRRWTHLAAVVDDRQVRLYVDGQEVGHCGIDAFPATALPLKPPSIGGGFAGGIRDVRIWHRALPASEIAQIANGHSPVSSDQLAAHWPLSEGTGQVLEDRGPHGTTAYLGRTAEVEPGADPYWISADLLSRGPFFEVQYLPYWVPESGIAADASGDGLPDLVTFRGITSEQDRFVCEYPYYVGTPPAQGVVFRNVGGGSFVEDASLVSHQLFSELFRVMRADLDGDGRVDVFGHHTGPEAAFWGVECDRVTGARSRLFIAQPGGGLREETLERLPPRIAYDHAGAVIDIDGDQDLDIVLLNGNFEDYADCLSQNFSSGVMCPVVLVNDGRGFFTEDFLRLPVSVRTMTPPVLQNEYDRRTYVGAAGIDVDRDGDLDLAVGAWHHAGHVPHDDILLNDGTGHFTVAADGTMPNRPGFDSPVNGGNLAVSFDAADFNRDGWPDLVAAQYGAIALYFNNHDGTFRSGDASLPAWANTNGASLCAVADFDGNSAPDFFCKNGPAGVVLFYNRGDGSFELMPPVDEIGDAGDVWPVDVDGDGDIDLLGNSGAFLQRKPYRPAAAR